MEKQRNGGRTDAPGAAGPQRGLAGQRSGADTNRNRAVAFLRRSFAGVEAGLASVGARFPLFASRYRFLVISVPVPLSPGRRIPPMAIARG